MELWKQLGILVRTQHCRYELAFSHRGLVQGKDASKLFMKNSRGCSLHRYGCPLGPVRTQGDSSTWHRVKNHTIDV